MGVGESGPSSEPLLHSPSVNSTLLWWIRMLGTEERHLEFISKSPLCLQFKPKRQRPIVPRLAPPTLSLKYVLPSSLTHSCFSGCFSCFSFASFLIFCNHSLSSFLNPSSPSTTPLAFFYQVYTTFQPQYLFRQTIFCSDAKLLSNNSTCSKSISTTIYCGFFPPYPPFIQVFSSSQLIVFALSDKENRFSSFQRTGART